MKTSGGNPGGGGGVPSSGGARLNPDLMGSADLDARSIESLVDAALTVAWERSPQEVERRLDALTEEGLLAEERKRKVIEQMRRERSQIERQIDRESVRWSQPTEAPAADSSQAEPTDTISSRTNDISHILPRGLRRRVLDGLWRESARTPDSRSDSYDPTTVLNAAALVQSDTTDYTPSQFERAFGFNPFRR